MTNYTDLLNNLKTEKNIERNQNPMWLLNIDKITKASDASIKLSDKALADYVPILTYRFQFSRNVQTDSYFQIPSGALQADELEFVIPIANLTSMFETSCIQNQMIKTVTLARAILAGSKWTTTDSFVFTNCYITAMKPSGDNMAASIKYATYQRQHNVFKDGAKKGNDAFGHNFIQGADIKKK